MRVLVACEFSGVVRRAFRALGHDAWSCDLLPAEDGSAHHIQGDAIAALCGRHGQFDLVIAHPPCTFLCNSGVRWLYRGGRGRVPDPARWEAMRSAAAFFLQFFHVWEGPVGVENPVMHRHARAIVGDPAARQIVQPWQFGHPETKATCLWLRGLPPLQPTHRSGDLFCLEPPAQRIARVHRLPPSDDRWRERSRTYPGIAAAMAAQWGSLSL